MANIWFVREAKSWAADWRQYYSERQRPEKYAALVSSRAQRLRASLRSANRWVQSAGMPSRREAEISVRWLEREAKRAEKAIAKK